jgi:hypothetical protein
MPNCVDETIKRPRGYQNRNVSRSERDQWIRMVSCFRRHKLIAVRHGVLTAIVGFGCRDALAFETALRGLLARCSSREAVKRPDEQNDCHQANRDVRATVHPTLE